MNVTVALRVVSSLLRSYCVPFRGCRLVTSLYISPLISPHIETSHRSSVDENPMRCRRGSRSRYDVSGLRLVLSRVRVPSTST